MKIGIIPDPLGHPAWPAIAEMLRPAAERGRREVLKPLEVVWAVFDGGALTGAATACLKEGDWGEVVLVGGRGVRRWIHDLDEKIGEWMRAEGMTHVRAFGRPGWRRVLRNWRSEQIDDETIGYERPL